MTSVAEVEDAPMVWEERWNELMEVARLWDLDCGTCGERTRIYKVRVKGSVDGVAKWAD